MKTKEDYIAAGRAGFESNDDTTRPKGEGWQSKAWDLGWDRRGDEHLAERMTSVKKPALVYKGETLVQVFRQQQRKVYRDENRRAEARIARAARNGIAPHKNSGPVVKSTDRLRAAMR